VYADVAERIRKLAESTFSASGLRLTAPTFFSRISGDKAPDQIAVNGQRENPAAKGHLG
jgi:hypothetical protein